MSLPKALSSAEQQVRTAAGQAIPSTQLQPGLAGPPSHRVRSARMCRRETLQGAMLSRNAYEKGHRCQVGYATGAEQARCEECRRRIAPNSLCIALLENAGPSWCHETCFPKLITNIFSTRREAYSWFDEHIEHRGETIPGFDLLADADKPRIVGMVVQWKQLNMLRYVVTIQERDADVGKVELICSNIAGDEVCPGMLMDKGFTAEDLAKRLALCLKKHRDDLQLVSPDSRVLWPCFEDI